MNRAISPAASRKDGADSKSDLASDIAKELECPNSRLVTIVLRETGEARQIDEPNGAGHAILVGVTGDERHLVRLPLFLFVG